VGPHDGTLRTKHEIYVEVSIPVSPIRDPSGEVVGASAIARDVRQRLEAERKIRASEERSRSIFERAPVGMMVAFEADRRIRPANAAIC
jgi:PAS domain-containing protein